MRITNKSVFIPYMQNLEGIQERRFKEDVRLSTGKQIVDLADAPEQLAQVKLLTNHIERNSQFKSNIEESLSEQYVVNEQISFISDNVQKIRELTIDGLNVSNYSNLYSIGVYIKGIIEDTVKLANMDFNGHFVFSGTKTTGGSLNKTPEASNDQPFEIITEAPTADNPSGLKVVFKGNFEDRVVNKDNYVSEVVNVKADQMFGDGGTKLFDSLINLYNKFAFDSNGNVRSDKATFSTEEFDRINEIQKTIGQFYDTMNTVSSENGAQINRFEQMRDQMQNEITYLEGLRSLKNDTDVATSTINLKREETALQYSLQVGSRLIQNSLFDFLK
ncbi:MAG: flagellar hook-associated protein 3 FlgL [Bacteroidota bacterium]|nr:flagellar hook-associated protein 3 FlgL [Bacteroidota bacterium]